jgi:hypothetical protein
MAKDLPLIKNTLQSDVLAPLYLKENEKERNWFDERNNL